MIRFSEYVSPGHPDKVADYISESLLDAYIKQDPNTRFAVEIQIKDKYVTLGGEVSSNAVLGEEDIAQTVRNAVNNIGYTKEYQDKWGVENTICGDSLVITSYISQQSREIAQGGNNEGWGDQGIFFGYAEPNDDTFGMPLDHTLAKRVNHLLFDSEIGGLDIKTQVVMDDDIVNEIIVAIPLMDSEDISKVEEIVRNSVKGDYHLIINGTGVFRKHSSIADCGVTGRKLVVDFYGGNARIGGGAPFSKDGSKADLTLNLLARYLAKKEAFKSGKAVETAIACCIGKKEIIVTSHILGTDIVKSEHLSISPSELIGTFDLNRPIFGSMCMWGLFGEFQQDKKWEQAV